MENRFQTRGPILIIAYFLLQTLILLSSGTIACSLQIRTESLKANFKLLHKSRKTLVHPNQLGSDSNVLDLGQLPNCNAEVMLSCLGIGQKFKVKRPYQK
ncbi:unnamed protein product [Strongylus vulgaris]|uniref:Uncharacterized protein n=1 Tax=Strongylus vulgaris TaxID=40348 RepID=A0A3P7J5H9_STRVU|nr:unnamed protein product [Strongylus vulgaris]